MILAAGLSPAWQQILLFDSFQLGEVNRAREVHWCASGKVLNVGIALSHLTDSARTLSLVGGNAGREIQEEFRRGNIPARWVEQAAATRVCTTLIDGERGQITELVENAAPLESTELDDFVQAYREEVSRADLVVLSGSLPEGTPVDFYEQLLRETEVRAVLDIRGPELEKALPLRPFLVKPNREELERTLQTRFQSDEDLIAGMQTLNHQGAEWVVVTQGDRPVWATTETQAISFPLPKVEAVVNPIGCGDCMAAGIAWALSREAGAVDAIRTGIAAATENLRQLLPARLNRDKVEALSQTIAVNEV